MSDNPMHPDHSVKPLARSSYSAASTDAIPERALREWIEEPVPRLEGSLPDPWRAGFMAALANLSAWLDEYTTKACDHEWIDIRNEVIQSGEMCSECGALIAGNEHTIETPSGGER